MNKHYKFRYRSKALNTLIVCLENLIFAMVSIPVLALISLPLSCFGIETFGEFFITISLSVTAVVFLILQTVYLAGRKGVTITDDKLIINYCCIVPYVHAFKKEILIKGIESAEFCSEPVNQRIEEVEGGAYNQPYVKIKYGYGGRKEVRLPLHNAEDFVNTINDITKEQGE